MGDINCRTGTANDFVNQENNQCELDITPYTIDDAIMECNDISILKHR